MPTIAIANQKGGVGKTTTAVNLSAALGQRGRSVCLVDLDPQANATLHSGLRPEEQEHTVWDAIRATATHLDAGVEELSSFLRKPVAQRQVSSGAIPIVSRPNDNEYDLIPSNIELAAADLGLVAAVSRERRLAAVLATLHGYDYIFIDCPPQLGVLSLNALCAADSVIVPLEASYLASKGMNQLFASIVEVQQTLNPQLDVLGILLTRVDQRTVHSRQIAAEARRALEAVVPVFTVEIPINVDLMDASAQGVSVLRYAPTSRGAGCYRQLAVEVDQACHQSE
ncbi:MAG: ParA family protein [Anaerolineae bacterium]